jgi:hypothetical protein
MRTLDTDPYEEGADAAIAGKPESANPYDLQTEEADHFSWNDGFASIMNLEDEE